MKIEVPLRAVLEAPPEGVRWALQRSKGDLSDLAAPTTMSSERITFEFTVQAELTAEGGVRLTGPAVQGPPTARFFYLNTGIYAADPGQAMGRRAKFGLSGLAWTLINSLKPGQRLEARIAGKAKDGGAACATVPILPPGWTAI